MAKKLPQASPTHHLREWRKHRKLSQEELADRVGATHGLISQLERGITGLTHERLERLALALDCQAADILSGPPGSPSQSPMSAGLGTLRAALGLFSQLSEARQRRIVESIEDAARAEGLQLPPAADGQ